MNNDKTATCTVTVTAQEEKEEADKKDEGGDSATDKTTTTIGDTTSADAKTIDALLDGKSAEELKTVTVVKVENAASLTTLSGLEKLTNLKKLDVSACPALETADLSRNANLKEVSVKDCVALSSVNVSGCAGLTTLSVQNCRSLTALDVKNCPSLEKMNVADGSLQTLEIGSCDRLVSLDCHANSLGRLDVESLVSLDVLNCAGQKGEWTPARRLDLSGYTGSAALSAARDASVGLASVNRVLAVTAYDAAGKEVKAEYDSATGIAAFASTPTTVVYFYDTGFRGVSMDVTLTGTPGPDTDTGSPASGHSGCDAGFAGLAALAVVPLLLCGKRN